MNKQLRKVWLDVKEKNQNALLSSEKNLTGVLLKAMNIQSQVFIWLWLNMRWSTVNRILLYFFRLCIFTLKDILKTQYKMIWSFSYCLPGYTQWYKQVIASKVLDEKDEQDDGHDLRLKSWDRFDKRVKSYISHKMYYDNHRTTIAA